MSVTYINNHKKKEKREIKASRQDILGPPDRVIYITTIMLVLFGLLAVFSASLPEASLVYNDSWFYLKKQIIFVALSIGMMFLASKWDYKKYRNVAVPFAVIAMILTGATLIEGLGKTVNGSSRWLVFLPIQPSELCKFAAIILLAHALSSSKKIIHPRLIMSVMLIGTMMLFILKQPNLSLVIIIAAVSFTMIFVTGFPLFWLASTISVGFYVVIKHIQHTPYQMDRITGWLNPWADYQGKGYNLIQSFYAIASGSFFGVGLGNSTQKFFYLPFRHTDFIFSIIAEELGFAGALVLIGMYSLLVIKGFSVAYQCEDEFGALMAIGITSLIAIQTIINICVATGAFPVTGVTLPFISYGGSSLMITTFMIGVLLNISRKRVVRIS